MKLRLSDGTYVDASMLSATSKSSSRRRENAPSKRQVKIGGGSLKRFHGRNTGANVGGTKNTITATYKNFEIDPETQEAVINRSFPPATCVTVNPTRRNFTMNVGGSCSTGYIGGRGV